MAYLAWPGLLPLPQRTGNSRAPADLSARSSVAGPALARRRFTWGRDTAPVTFVATNLQLAVLDAWWHLRLGQGCAWFQMPIADDSGTSIEVVRMAGGYRAELVGRDRWRVSASLEIEVGNAG